MSIEIQVLMWFVGVLSLGFFVVVLDLVSEVLHLLILIKSLSQRYNVSRVIMCSLLSINCYVR